MGGVILPEIASGEWLTALLVVDDQRSLRTSSCTLTISNL